MRHVDNEAVSADKAEDGDIEAEKSVPSAQGDIAPEEIAEDE